MDLSFLFDALNVAVQLDADCEPGFCPASAFTATTAAFATQGYFAQADLLWTISFTRFGNWAILIYICGAIGGMLSFVLGNPPRNYLWFFLGPAFYNWLIDTTVETKGVRWEVGLVPQDQTQVWRLAEAGLVNSNVTLRDGIQIKNNAPPDQPVKVSLFFIWWDDLVSGSTQWLVRWTGLNRQLMNSTAGNDTNLVTCANEECQAGFDPKWHILSPLKWQLLENITQARLHDPMLRDAFVTFMSSECGDALVDGIKTDNYISAATGQFKYLPITIFKEGARKEGQYFRYTGEFTTLHNGLRQQVIPAPRSLKAIFEDLGDGGAAAPEDDKSVFRNFSDTTRRWAGEAPNWEAINCGKFLKILITAFRWEAGHIYHQMINSPDYDLHPNALLSALFYGWDIKEKTDPTNWAERGTIHPATFQPGFEPYKVFAYNLILMHLFKNEFELAPSLPNARVAYSKETETYSDTYLKVQGSKSKFGELYSWSQLIFYVQGILLYFLAMGFPVACMLVVMPGWNKIMFTWMSFWAWVKLWDVGFALVMVIERTIWSMFNNSAETSTLNALIFSLYKLGLSTSVICPDVDISSPLSGTCAIPEVQDVSTISPDRDLWVSSLALLDRALLLSSSMNYDLANGYYIFIMASLYLSVPAVTGQLVLAGRAGAAGMVNSMIGGAAQGAGGTAAEGYKGGAATRATLASNVAGNEAVAKEYRNPKNLAKAALDASGPGAFGSSLAAAELGVAQQGNSAMSNAIGMNQQNWEAAVKLPQSQIGMLSGMYMASKGLIAAVPGGGGGAAPGGGGGAAPGGGGGAAPGGGAGAPGGAAGMGVPKLFGALGGMLGDVGAVAGWFDRVGGASLPGMNQAAAGALGVAGGQRQQHMLNRQMALAAENQDMAIAGFAGQQSAAAYGQAAERMGAAAQHDAGYAKYQAMSRYADAKGGMMTAKYGMMAGGLASMAQRPEERNGMMYAGMGNSYDRNGNVVSDASGAFNFFRPPGSPAGRSPGDGRGGQAFGMIGGAQGRLDAQRGGAQVAGMYQNYSPNGAFMSGIQQGLNAQLPVSMADMGLGNIPGIGTIGGSPFAPQGMSGTAAASEQGAMSGLKKDDPNYSKDASGTMWGWQGGGQGRYNPAS